MRIVVWNMKSAKAKSPAWKYFADLAPDLALLQDVSGIPDSIRQAFQIEEKKAITKNDTPQNFSTCILVRGTLSTPIVLTNELEWVNQELERFKGNLVPRTVVLSNNQALLVLSAYSPAWPITRARLTGIDVSPVKLVNNPELWVTEILWTALRSQEINGNTPWVIGGDLNCCESFDLTWSSGNAEILDRMKGLGLTECLREAQGKLTPTYLNPKTKEIKCQIDYLFVSDSLAKQLTSCNTGDANVVFSNKLSDHLPIIADFQ